MSRRTVISNLYIDGNKGDIVVNSATTGASEATPDTLALRDENGDFSAHVITAELNGNATTATTASSFTSELGGVVTGSQSATTIANGAITNAMLAPITSSGKVANSATSAASTNTPNTIALRDASGNLSANVVTASLNGNAATATSATSATSATTATSFSGQLAGVVTGTQSATTIGTNAITNTMLATINTPGKVANAATTATNANTASSIVARDASGNFTANVITASLTGNATTATSATSATTATTATTATNFSGSLAGVVTGTQSATTIGTNAITNTMLATINTANKVTNAATTATSANTANAIVARDASGNFTANNITASTMAVNAIDSTSGGLSIGGPNAATLALGAYSTSITMGSGAGTINIGTSTIQPSDITMGGSSSDSLTMKANTNSYYTTAFKNDGNTYPLLKFVGGNSYGGIYSNFPALGDGIYLGYNYFYEPGNNTAVIPASGGGTSRIKLGYSDLQLGVGATGTAPTFYLGINSSTPGFVTLRNGAYLNGNATGLTDSHWNYNKMAANFNSGPTGASQTPFTSRICYNLIHQSSPVVYLVTFSVENCTFPTGPGPAIGFTASGIIPSTVRPSSQVSVLIHTESGSGATTGEATISTSGNLTITQTVNTPSVDWHTTGSSGLFRGFTIQYIKEV